MPEAVSAWAPLRRPDFRALWIASVASHVGTWMHDVATAWMMTSLSPSPLLPALIQTASTLPVFLLALPAGALADVVDRRRILLLCSVGMGVTSAALGLLVLGGSASPALLLGAAAVLGVGTAFHMPAWQAVTPTLVPAGEVSAAVTLGGVGFNASRAVGPALGGVLVAAAGPGPVFLLNAVSFAAVWFAVWRAKDIPSRGASPEGRVLAAMRTGLRFARHEPRLRAVLARSVALLLAASALWALLPTLARGTLGLTAAEYGILLGCLGTGAVTGSFLIPRLRASRSLELLHAGGAVVLAGAFAALATVRTLAPACAVMFVGGLAWILLIPGLNIAAYAATPAWVRGRALAVFLLVFQGSLAAGSILWGLAAERLGAPGAMMAAAGAMLLGIPAALRWRLPEGREVDLSPSLHWAAPVLRGTPAPNAGPVIVTVEYRVDPSQRAGFVEAMRGLERIRRRDGACQWHLSVDAADPIRVLETFLVESWEEHLRQHERGTVADREAEDRVRAFHEGGEPPRVTHLVPVIASRPPVAG